MMNIKLFSSTYPPSIKNSLNEIFRNIVERQFLGESEFYRLFAFSRKGDVVLVNLLALSVLQVEKDFDLCQEYSISRLLEYERRLPDYCE